MIIDEPRPLCSGCGRPLKRSTYHQGFRNLLPNGKEWPTTIAECQSLVETGHHIIRFKYIREPVRDSRGLIVDYGDGWHFYGASVWTGTYGTFGQCGKCLPYDKSIAYGKTLKVLSVPVDPAPEAGAPSGLFRAIVAVVRERALAVRSRFGRAGVPAAVELEAAAPVGLADLSSERAPFSYPLPTNSAAARFLEVPVFEATDAEIVLMWRAFAHQRNEYAAMLDEDPTNRHARERYDMLKGCMLKMRAQAEARGVSVDFNPPEIIKFSGLEWHDLEPEDEPGFGGFE